MKEICCARYHLISRATQAYVLAEKTIYTVKYYRYIYLKS